MRSVFSVEIEEGIDPPYRKATFANPATIFWKMPYGTGSLPNRGKNASS